MTTKVDRLEAAELLANIALCMCFTLVVAQKRDKILDSVQISVWGA